MENKSIYDVIGKVSRLTAVANATATDRIFYQTTIDKNILVCTKGEQLPDNKWNVLWKEQAFLWEENCDNIIYRLLDEIADNVERQLKERQE